VELREVREADLPIFYEHQRDPEATAVAVFPAREWDAFLKHWTTTVLGNPTNLMRTIVADGAVAGYVGSWSGDDKRLVAYWLGRELWGRGVATAALRAFLREEATRPIHAFVAASNVGSRRVLERAAFVVVDRHVGADGVEEHLMRLDA
jgi:RimJ/RimL family protein N-acetyltransferase